eukprot:10571424-Alexandrium_andersonii.AAC.1
MRTPCEQGVNSPGTMNSPDTTNTGQCEQLDTVNTGHEAPEARSRPFPELESNAAGMSESESLESEAS